MSKQEMQTSFDTFWEACIPLITKPPLSTALTFHCKEVCLGGSLVRDDDSFSPESDIDLLLFTDFNPIEEGVPAQLKLIVSFINSIAESHQLPLHISLLMEKNPDHSYKILLTRT